MGPPSRQIPAREGNTRWNWANSLRSHLPLNKNLVNQDPKGQAPSTTPRTLCAQATQKHRRHRRAKDEVFRFLVANLLSSPIEERMTKDHVTVHGPRQLFHNYHPFTDHQALRDDYGYHSSRFRQRASSKRGWRTDRNGARRAQTISGSTCHRRYTAAPSEGGPIIIASGRPNASYPLPTQPIPSPNVYETLSRTGMHPLS